MTRPWWDVFDECEGAMEKIRGVTLFHRHYCICRRTACVWILKRWPFIMVGVSDRCRRKK
jgi:hypothetical protein